MIYSYNRKIIVISPHPDDAAFSIGGLLSKLKNNYILLITCFNQSCVREKADATITTSIRSREDEFYSKFIGAGIIRLGLHDTSIRTNIGAEIRSKDEEMLVRSSLTDRLTSKVNQFRKPIVFVPLAIGGHPDHLHCREAAILNLTKHCLIFYEDLPYGQFEGGPNEVKKYIKQTFPLLCETNVSLTACDMNKKLYGIDLYKSQIHPHWRRDIINYSLELKENESLYNERYWSLPSHQAILSSITGK